MKKFASTFVWTTAFLFAMATLAAAQMNMSEDKSKRPSPPASTECKFSDGKSVKIDYSSPRAKERYSGRLVKKRWCRTEKSGGRGQMNPRRSWPMGM
jgi:hypothetical protein